MTYTVRETCRLCDARLPDERVLDLGETPLANELVRPAYEVKAYDQSGYLPEPLGPRFHEQQTYPLFLKQCSACGHVQLPVVVDPELLFPPDYPYQSATGASMREHLASMARDLAEDLFPKGGLVAEIGSNDGFLLSEFREQGLRTVGIDPALALASSATRDGSLTVPEFFNVATAYAVRNACGPAQLIVANNVFAHADDLHEIVEGVKVLLAPEGRFVFEVGYLGDVLRTNNFPAVYHEHLSVHSVIPLVAFFERHGLRLYRYEPVATQGGSIRCFVAYPDRCVEHASAGAAKFLENDWKTGVCRPELIQGWQTRVNEAARGFRRALETIKLTGHSIAAYGCSAKSTTLLHVAGIGREAIDFICDDAPTKQGKFSPGFHIPIVPGSWLEEKQPDYCVSLSGNFSEAFKAAHPLYKGVWIEPDLGGGA